eukprot:TRINITY_DN3206_c0_g2_i1.p1 TRINITY_DN3206_c0_g2~~TRINITY_DN3206_c0_g2_i1.p1  ORF type:complete len:263 (+),score=38.53 TRINITY_DN3206_c0_g2_i1:146-934(+)
MARVWILGLLLVEVLRGAKAEWNYESIGKVKRAEFYHEKDELKGIFVTCEEGTVAMLEPNNGSIIWRKSIFNKPILKSTIKQHCNLPLVILDGVILMKQNTTEVIDLRDGNLIAEVNITQNDTVAAYTDIKIISATEENTTYGIMTSSKVRVFQKDKEVWKLSADPNELFVFMEYDSARDELLVGCLTPETNKIHVKRTKDKKEIFSLDYVRESDVLMKVEENILVTRMPPKYEETSVSVYRISDQVNFVNNFTNSSYKVIT